MESATTTATAASQKRVTRACDNCKSRRTRCEPSHGAALSPDAPCQACMDNHLTCKFEAPVRKRGPQPGSRKRPHSSDSPLPTPRSPPRYRTRTASSITPNSPPQVGGSSVGDPDPSASGSRAPSVIRPRPRQPFGGVPSKLIDQLLPLYFAHVHNVWPLVYKPTFNPHTTSAPLLLSMLAIASCVVTTPSSEQDGFPADRLFRMAEQSLHECRNDCRIDLIQSLVLLSLRQTGCGDKQSASTYAGRACCMALNMGLNLSPAGHLHGRALNDATEKEIRSRVYWNTYVLDKTLSEESGRPFLLSYRRTTTPLPSTDELEELETWPPTTLSASAPSHRALHISPRRGYVMSCFAWTCRLAMIVEDILNLDSLAPPPINSWDQHFFLDRPPSGPDAAVISEQLDQWRASLPPNLDVNPASAISPLPHHAVGMAWYHTSLIMLHSRFIRRTRNPSQSPLTTVSGPSSASARQICAKAAQASIDILSCLDKHQLLSVASSDVLHMLSLTALFEAFETTNSDPQVAKLAKANFSLCCGWLRDVSSSWPAASSHRLFFEGLIKGGLQISSHTHTHTARVPATPRDAVPRPSAIEAEDDTPSTPLGLRVMRRHLSISEDDPSPSLIQLAETAAATATIDSSPAVNPSALFQLPQIYWNSINSSAITAPPANVVPPSWDSLLDFNFGNSVTGIGMGTGNPFTDGSVDQSPTAQLSNHEMEHQWTQMGFGGAEGGGGGQLPFVPAADASADSNATVQSALMSFMMEAARGGQ